MKDQVCSIYREIAGLLISSLYLIVFRPTLGVASGPSPDESFTLSKMLIRVGNVLGQHKFFERDIRKDKPEEQPLVFMERFPVPPIDDIPEMIRGDCDRGIVPCLRLIDYLSYKRLSRADLFTFRVAASYYLCWYTMHEEPLLRHFGSECQVPYPDPDKVIDYRGWDKMPFDCALHNFCPDPCCGSHEPVIDMSEPDWRNRETPKGFSRTKKICTETKGYPCGITEQACSLNFKKNRNWEDLKRNRLNTTCSCGKTAKNYVWNERFKMCVDRDECRDGTFDCEPNSICRNLESDYYCTCRLGYKFDFNRKRCVRDLDFEFDEALRVQAGMEAGQTPGIKAENASFQWATYFYWLIDHSNSQANRKQRHDSVAIWTLALVAQFNRCNDYN